MRIKVKANIALFKRPDFQYDICRYNAPLVSFFLTGAYFIKWYNKNLF